MWTVSCDIIKYIAVTLAGEGLQRFFIPGSVYIRVCRVVISSVRGLTYLLGCWFGKRGLGVFRTLSPCGFVNITRMVIYPLGILDKKPYTTM